MSNGRNYECPRILKPNESTIQQMVNARCQQEAVLSVQAFLVYRVPPGFQVTRHEMS
jgi:hypothetical protein